MDKPLILLSNDDGVYAPFLQVMRAILIREFAARVLTVAPEKERSAMSQTITLHKPLRVRNIEEDVYSVSGSPVDCVYIGCLKLAERTPDLVISGPNDGFNVGTDVFYSGTVGAALEGGMRGVPSISVSVERSASEVVERAALTCVSLGRMLLEERRAAPQSEPPGVLNLNVPRDHSGELRWTRLGRRFYEDDVHERTDPRGRQYYWIGGGIAGIADIEGSDCVAVAKGRHMSVTPLSLDLTCHQALNDKLGRQ